MTTTAEPLLLKRIDDSRNMARFYRLSVEKTLFDAVALRRNWGRIGTWGQERLDLYADARTAERALARSLSAKLRRGYRPA